MTWNDLTEQEKMVWAAEFAREHQDRCTTDRCGLELCAFGIGSHYTRKCVTADDFAVADLRALLGEGPWRIRP